MITVEQIKAARVMLDLKQRDLAKISGISIATLNNIERGAQTDPKISTIKAIRGALEKEGIKFINDSFEGIGVCLKHRDGINKNAVILIVDDNKADRTMYKVWLSALSNRNYIIKEADNAHAGFDALVEYKPDCVILDFMMYGADGFQLLAMLKREQAKIPPIIFVTGMHNDNMEQTAKSQGVSAYLKKQFISKERLCEAVENALRKTS